MKISRREKLLLLIAVYLLIIFGGYKYVISPTQAKLSQVKAVNSTIDQQVQKAVQEGKLSSNSQSAISRELASYLKLEEQLPRDKQLVELVDQLGKTADENEVTLLSVGYTDTKEQTAAQQAGAQTPQQSVLGASNMNLNLSVSGSYYHLLGFLQALEKSPRIIVVKTANMSVGKVKEIDATAVSGSNGTYSGNSSNPPPSAPISKGSRIQTSVSTRTMVTAQNTASEPNVPEMTKYDTGNIQMNLQIISYYDQTQTEMDKLLGSKLAKQVTDAKSTITATDANLVKVTAAVKKFWDKNNPSADWGSSLNPSSSRWNGALLKYLEGKYNNTNMGKNVRGLVNPLAAKINPNSDWAGTAIFHWNRVLDMSMSSTVKPTDPDTGKTYTNVKTKDFFPVAVYITYLPQYAPDKVASLSTTQKQAVTGSIIVWQAQNSKAAPVIYRIDEKGQLQDLQKLE